MTPVSLRTRAAALVIGGMISSALVGCAEMNAGGAPARPDAPSPIATTYNPTARGQDSRGTAPAVEDTRKVAAPKTAFNPADYDPARLAPGRSTITGYACASQQQAGGLGAGGGILYARNADVFLLPYSDYLMETLTLIDRNRYDHDTVRVEYDKAAFATKIVGRTNKDAKFEFKQIKPGRYLLAAEMGGTLARNVNVPHSDYDGASNTVYLWNEDRHLQRDYSAVMYTEVVVHNDGDVVETKLAPPTRIALASFIPFIGNIGGGNNNLPTIWGCNPNKSGIAQHLN